MRVQLSQPNRQFVNCAFFKTLPLYPTLCAVCVLLTAARCRTSFELVFLNSIYFNQPITSLYFFNIEGSIFTFFVCSLCPFYHRLVHVKGHPVVSFASFLLPLVALCSLTVPDHSSMLPSTFFVSFPSNCPKYWCFSSLPLLSLTHMPV